MKMATEKQVALIEKLARERTIVGDAARFTMAHPEVYEHPESLTSGQASWFITLLLGCPVSLRLPKEGDTEPATEKQIAFLKSLREKCKKARLVDQMVEQKGCFENFTKSEASYAISLMKQSLGWID